jgi:pimeloyl-ACP methyl ester carboxylesterase
MPTFRSHDQTELHYATHGPATGVPLLLIHGFPFDGRLFGRVTDALAATHRLIVPDLRGFGRSGAPAGPYTMEGHARDLVALLDHLAVERAYVGGHSMGGYVALALAEAAPQRLAGLALLHSHPFADDEAGRKGRYDLAATIAGLDRAAWNAAMRTKAVAPGYAEPEGVALLDQMIAAAAPTAVAAAAIGMALRPDRSHVWQAFAGPALFMYGVHDAFIPPARAAAIRALRSAALTVEAPAGHASMIEAPAAFAAAVRAWLGTQVR